MSSTRLTISLAVLAVAGVYGFQGPLRSPVNRPWPPAVQSVSDASPALTPEQALQTFYMPPGYRLELVAAEPLIRDPIVMDWDTAGRIWAVEMPGFVPNLSAPEPNLNPIGRIVVLEDSNGDGVMDRRTVFADGLVLPRALKVLDRGVLVGEPPNVWLMHDKNGDLKMDSKELVTNQYGRREARVEQNANDFHWALDNWMHTANGDVYLRLKAGKFETRKTLSRGEWGVTHDDAGRIYRNTNESSVHVDYVPTPYFLRNPNLLRTRGSYEAIRDDDNAVNEVWPVRPNPGTNRAYQFGIDRPDGTLWHFTAVCAPLVYRGDRLPSDTYGNVFVAEPAANLVSRIVLGGDSGRLEAKKAYERGEFLASTDERFRPVFLSNAPDGTLYIVDMYRGVIQQRADVTEYLRDHIVRRKLEEPTGLGRIYRVVHETTTRDTSPALSKATQAQLVDALSHPNGWRRDTAQRLLVERGAGQALPALVRAAETASDAKARLHALWTLDGLDRIDPGTVTRALEAPSADVRAAAVRIAERWLADSAHPIHAVVLERLGDADWSVRRQLAASIGALPEAARDSAAARVLERYGDDPITMDAALSSVRGGEVAVLELLAASAEQTPQRDAALTMVGATVVRGGLDTGVQRVLALVAEETRAAWQRSAILRAVEVAVINAPMPGASAARRGNSPATAPGAPCPTCPGGRAGPGGAYAFPQAPAAARAGNRMVRLNSEPTAFTALAGRPGELGQRVATLVARIEWPGKAGASAPIQPLSPDEQRRFNEGQDVYRNICVTCHQPDGRGQERLSANLVGSPLALASPDIPARILLNGKEGPIGLMPPVGSLLSDEQIAGVLTYIRREWGQAGSPVDVAIVRRTRDLTAGRTRPWSHDELTKMAASGRGGH